jgi:hypothetical protein
MLPLWGYGEYRLSCIEVQASVPAPGRSTAAGALAYVGAATVAPPCGESEAALAEIAANRRISASFEALVPEMEAICGGGLISRTPRLNDEIPL